MSGESKRRFRRRAAAAEVAGAPRYLSACVRAQLESRVARRRIRVRAQRERRSRCVVRPSEPRSDTVTRGGSRRRSTSSPSHASRHRASTRKTARPKSGHSTGCEPLRTLRRNDAARTPRSAPTCQAHDIRRESLPRWPEPRRWDRNCGRRCALPGCPRARQPIRPAETPRPRRLVRPRVAAMSTRSSPPPQRSESGAVGAKSREDARYGTALSTRCRCHRQVRRPARTTRRRSRVQRDRVPSPRFENGTESASRIT